VKEPTNRSHPIARVAQQNNGEDLPLALRNTLQYTATQRMAPQHTATTATHCNTLQHTAFEWMKDEHGSLVEKGLQNMGGHLFFTLCPATHLAHCNKLHCTAPRCTTLPHTATRCTVCSSAIGDSPVALLLLGNSPHESACCSVVQCGTVWCSVL